MTDGKTERVFSEFMKFQNLVYELRRALNTKLCFFKRIMHIFLLFLSHFFTWEQNLPCYVQNNTVRRTKSENGIAFKHFSFVHFPFRLFHMWSAWFTPSKVMACLPVQRSWCSWLSWYIVWCIIIQVFQSSMNPFWKFLRYSKDPKMRCCCFVISNVKAMI